MPNSVQIELTVPMPTVIASFHVRQIAGDGGGTGPQGPQGEPGEDGLSAYEIWLAAGNTGTEQDFLDSLVGEQGPQGIQGEQGPQGATGENGLSAYEIWLAEGNEGTELQFLYNLIGPGGPQGPQGEQGLQGPTGPAGSTTIEGIAGLSEALAARVLKVDIWRAVITVDSAEVFGTVGVLKLACIEVPAGTFAVGTDVLVRSRVRRVSGNAGWTNSIYVNTIDNMSGAILLGTASSSASITYNQMKRDLVVKGAQTEVYDVLQATQTDDAVVIATADLVSINWAVKQYIIFTATASNTTDRFVSSYALVEGRKSI